MSNAATHIPNKSHLSLSPVCAGCPCCGSSWATAHEGVAACGRYYIVMGHPKSHERPQMIEMSAPPDASLPHAGAEAQAATPAACPRGVLYVYRHGCLQTWRRRHACVPSMIHHLQRGATGEISLISLVSRQLGLHLALYAPRSRQSTASSSTGPKCCPSLVSLVSRQSRRPPRPQHNPAVAEGSHRPRHSRAAAADPPPSLLPLPRLPPPRLPPSPSHPLQSSRW